MKDVTYGKFLFTVQSDKSETNCTHFMVGGNCINYPGKVATPIAKILVEKLLLNSVISTKGTQFRTMHVSSFYLMAPLKRPKYVCIKISNIPNKVINEYNLREKASKNSLVCIKTTKGVYGLP